MQEPAGELAVGPTLAGTVGGNGRSPGGVTVPEERKSGRTAIATEKIDESVGLSPEFPAPVRVVVRQMGGGLLQSRAGQGTSPKVKVVAGLSAFVLLLVAVLVLLAGIDAMRLQRVLSQLHQIQDQVGVLSNEVQSLRHRATMSSAVFEERRRSICYLYAEYELRPPQDLAGERPLRLQLSGTGFVVAPGWIATNRHVLQAAFESSVGRRYLRLGAMPKRRQLLAFFPGLAAPVTVGTVHFSSTADLALAELVTTAETEPAPLPLAKQAPLAGDPVLVLGYPLGIAGMRAKDVLRERPASSGESVQAAAQMARLSLLRPSATWGHLGDVVGETLMYDAATAHGSSGGPVFNSRGEVVAINSAYVEGFTGGSLGVSVSELKELLSTLP